ncbi:MAG: HNH endonuclease [Bdellovibrionales bacterium]|nr:HNH endonuclease [Bdellovibrionales bacterium]
MQNNLSFLTDAQLVDRLSSLVAAEHVGIREVVFHLAEMERRRLYAVLGFSSLYDYSIRELGYSKSAAMRRIRAARCIERFPHAAEKWERGELSLNVIEVLSGVMDERATEDDVADLLEAVSGKSASEAEAIVACRFPAREVALRDRVRPVGVRRASIETCPDGAPLLGLPTESPDQESRLFRGGTTVEPTEGSVVEVQHRVSFTACERVMRKLQRAQTLKRRPGGKKLALAEVLEEALDAYLSKYCPEERLKRRRHRAQLKAKRSDQHERTLSAAPKSVQTNEAVATKQEIQRGEEGRRYVPEEVRDRVLERDGYQCTYVACGGRRCDERQLLEIDHILPVARGGTSEINNLRTLCRTHNVMMAELEFGRAWMQSFRRERLMCAGRARQANLVFGR